MKRLVGTRKYKVDTQAVCSNCFPEQEYSGQTGETVDTWARRHVREHPDHIVTIHETHDVSANASITVGGTPYRAGTGSAGGDA